MKLIGTCQGGAIVQMSHGEFQRITGRDLRGTRHFEGDYDIQSPKDTWPIAVHALSHGAAKCREIATALDDASMKLSNRSPLEEPKNGDET